MFFVQFLKDLWPIFLQESSDGSDMSWNVADPAFSTLHGGFDDFVFQQDGTPPHWHNNM